MILLVDIGNSRIKWAWSNPAGMGAMTALAHDHAPSAALWERLWGEAETPSEILVANVAGEAFAHSLSEWVLQRWGSRVFYAHASAAAGGVANGYREPERLGVDRWLALLGARGATQHPVCVVDCGTAVTVDGLDAAGVHQGGWIAPGLRLMSTLLVQGTDSVRVTDACDDNPGLGRDTPAAVCGGIQHAVAGLVQQALVLLPRHEGMPPRCLVTGGDAARLLRLLPKDCEHIPDLVLRGLLAWHMDREKRG